MQLAVGDGAFWVSGTSTAMGRLSPRAIDGATSRTLLVVDDPDSVMRRAVANGATESSPTSDEHGWRLGRIIDHSAMNGRSELHSENGRRSDPYANTCAPRPPARHDQLVHQSVRRTGAGGGPTSGGHARRPPASSRGLPHLE